MKPNPEVQCPACYARRRHSAEELAAGHPLAGHGFGDGQGWSTESAKEAHDLEAKQLAEMSR